MISLLRTALTGCVPASCLQLCNLWVETKRLGAGARAVLTTRTHSKLLEVAHMAGTDTEEVVVHMFSTVLDAAGRQVKVVMWLASVRGRCQRCCCAAAGSPGSAQWLLTTATLWLLRPLTQLYPL